MKIVKSPSNNPPVNAIRVSIPGIVEVEGRGRLAVLCTLTIVLGILIFLLIR